jgi:hypothetical protein
MSKPLSDELLLDSEASLRLVDRALTDLRVAEPSATPGGWTECTCGAQKEVALMDLPNMLLRAYTEINSVLQNLRRSRDVLQQTTLEKIHHTNDKLREVTSATELAATDMLDGLDRALAMIDELDSFGDDDLSREGADEVRANLRNELFSLMNCLQFQDITTQQLNYASSVLVEMESRLAEIARIFDPDRLGLRDTMIDFTDSDDVSFDPAATTADAGERQALVDAIFTRR